ncbi:50S ribosomal protein L5 [Sulfolobus acidocaldarius]|uniref:Large ribosomal subunit protein uL5 n=5 Tax=Sulfolobus acidocaldarius TaxID=2285 RepID=RL5_SULAC|nr:50S ribosomal protein L5 [Sulfolobus acidocaldarius]P41202.1 RecName: Full=Large ribosomal subunit protein uL5; AltName: Full=50S ribosomal protein L5 [Sulfolobus acidocaldarius DSM 639]AAB21095.1 ribosomal protein L5 [Sulfolobus acidocaldarius]AAY79976.1 50S ribosomal protein L5P [Sulfolobus acidocaldarius DSM 639]AGE70545.1 50S ribosomal protein L5P [Sulfolobus acidocaldarius N8]AGE72818.1 50S ribosomal protein L5P [Sulfolobus acidocaldarius Ron12/I]ALU29096.1 50S ribosomal protein L5 [S
MSMQEAKKENVMRRVVLDKVTVNIGVGESGERLQKAYQLVQELTGVKPVYTKGRKSIREFGVRKGAPIGVKATLRRQAAVEFLKKVLPAVNFRLKQSSFDNYGNVSFGIAEHVLIPGTRYDPEIGIFGMDVAITLVRPGYRTMKRKRKKASIPRRHRVTKEEAINFMKENFNVTILEG